MIRSLIFGDVFGKAGRSVLTQNLGKLKATYNPDIVIANGENLAGGFGLTDKVFLELIEAGVDCMTSGNHWADKKEVHLILPDDRRLVIPANMSNVKHPHLGFSKLESKNGKKYSVINLIGRVFMNTGNSNPFEAVNGILEQVRDHSPVVFLDFHGEATSEKYAMAHYLTGRISMIWGTHTHVQTADEQILGGKTGYITDIGMTGPYDSVIGIKKKLP